MQIGIWLPSTEFDVPPERLIRFASDMESLGLDYLESSDHVLTTRLPAEHRSATMMSRGYHEPLLLFAMLAPYTSLAFATSVLVLPQRPAALVAKQMADLAWWLGDRFRFGLGSGWNAPEFEALGVDFARRGAILSDQVAVIDALWTGHYVDYAGPHHRLEGVGIAPRPPRARPPLWFGGHSRRVLERVARHGEGWMPLVDPDNVDLSNQLQTLRRLLEDQGRDPASLGLEGRIDLPTDESMVGTMRAAERWRALGASHLTLSYEGAGFADLDRVTESARLFAERWADQD